MTLTQMRYFYEASLVYLTGEAFCFNCLDYLLFYDLIFHIAALVSLSSLSVFLRFLFSF